MAEGQVRTENAEGGEEIGSQEPLADGMALADGSAAWSNLWQIPTILTSLVLIIGGVFYGSNRMPENDFDGALDRAEQLIEAQQLDIAQALLRDTIQPRLEEATDLQRGRFSAAVADLIHVGLEVNGTGQRLDQERIDDRYRSAIQQGVILSVARIERWATALVELGDMQAAQHRMDELEGLSTDDDRSEEARNARNRVLRRLVEKTLRQPDLSHEVAMSVLGEYRADRLLAVGDEIWAAARQAELRLDDGQTREAINHLHIDMRLIEPRLAGKPEPIAELYMLLGRGYYEIGEHDFARQQIERTLAAVPSEDAVSGDALVVLGLIALETGLTEEALDTFGQVVTDFESTRSYLPGLLGRAEALGILGKHEESQADYNHLRNRLGQTEPRRGVTPDRVGQSLMDRHDAALASGRLDVAIRYINIADGIEAAHEIMVPILFRLASTNRQIADNLIAEAVATIEPGEEIDAAVRVQASVHYKRAGEYFVEHSRRLRPLPTEDEAWAASLFQAADNFDKAGYFELAIEHFREYEQGRTDADPIRTEARFRLARCLQATADFPAAIDLYSKIIDEHPQSKLAAESLVPRAQCLIALEQFGAGEQDLLFLVSGDAGLEPDALEYKDALLALGTLYHNLGSFSKAIEQLDRFFKYYADDVRLNEALFRLAGSYRGEAGRLADALAEGNLTRSRLEEMMRLRREHLIEAMTLFGQVKDRYESIGVRRLDSLQKDYLRNSYLYRADCAFELGDLQQAIELYDLAARKYGNHPSSLIALIQIVNAYVQLGDQQRARTAHHRAQLRLQQLPANVFDSPDSPMNEPAWRMWLDSLPPGFEMASAGGGQS